MSTPVSAPKIGSNNYNVPSNLPTVSKKGNTALDELTITPKTSGPLVAAKGPASLPTLSAGSKSVTVLSPINVTHVPSVAALTPAPTPVSTASTPTSTTSTSLKTDLPTPSAPSSSTTTSTGIAAISTPSNGFVPASSLIKRDTSSSVLKTEISSSLTTDETMEDLDDLPDLANSDSSDDDWSKPAFNQRGPIVNKMAPPMPPPVFATKNSVPSTSHSSSSARSKPASFVARFSTPTKQPVSAVTNSTPLADNQPAVKTPLPKPLPVPPTPAGRKSPPRSTKKDKSRHPEVSNDDWDEDAWKDYLYQERKLNGATDESDSEAKAEAAAIRKEKRRKLVMDSIAPQFIVVDVIDAPIIPSNNGTDEFLPVVANGSVTDGVLTTMLMVRDRWCLVLVRLWDKATEEYIQEYSVANFLPNLADLVVFNSAHRALLYYDTEEEYEDACEVAWPFGVVCPVARLDPKGDHGAFFRAVYFCYSNFMTSLEMQVNTTLKAINVKFLSAAWSDKYRGQLSIYVESETDYRTLIAHGKPLHVAGIGAQQVSILQPKLHKFMTNAVSIAQCYAGTFPADGSLRPEKVLDAVRRSVRMGGAHNPNDVLCFAFQKHQKSGKNASYGFFQVKGRDLVLSIIDKEFVADGHSFTLTLAKKGDKRQ